MGAAVERLTRFVSDESRFDSSHAELRAAQVEALNERFQERKDQIKLLGHRAKEAGATEIGSIADMVPLLFPHTAYKSYPEGWLMEEKWDRLTKWLGTVSSHPIKPIDLNGVEGVDDWIGRLQAAGHYISCSSGTTGKSAMLIASDADMDWSKVDTVNVFAWGSGVKPAQDRLLVGTGAVASVPKNMTISAAQKAAFGHPEWGRIDYPVPPITVGSLTKKVVLRKKIADGTAKPGELADFEQTSKERQEAIDGAVGITAQRIVDNREKKLMLAGLWNGLYHVAKAVRELGYSAKDFNPDNCIYVGGGLKRAQLPADYQQFVHETFNIPEGRHFQNYSMQELNSGMPKCREGGRYHVPPWIVPFVLNKDGDALADGYGEGEVEGRAAFFDLSLDGRWGGVISGDKISLSFEPCGCGRKGPSVRDNIVRYADLEGDDKIGCAGTVDAYVRGVA
jgi:hypothetical protein